MNKMGKVLLNNQKSSKILYIRKGEKDNLIGYL